MFFVEKDSVSSDRKMLISNLDSYSIKGKSTILLIVISEMKKNMFLTIKQRRSAWTWNWCTPGFSLVSGLFLFLQYIKINIGESDCYIAIFADDTTIIQADRESNC